jgi:hypothetical protein
MLLSLIFKSKDPNIFQINKKNPEKKKEKKLDSL